MPNNPSLAESKRAQILHESHGAKRVQENSKYYAW